MKVKVIGGGLAGTEACYQLLKKGIAVDLIEMRPIQTTPAHKTDNLAELVCSNSLRSDDFENTAIGLLHQEMRLCDSLIMQAADFAKLPAGSALAVDRKIFSKFIQDKLTSFSNFTLIHQEADFPEHTDYPVIIATGPLTAPKMADALSQYTGEDNLHFFDAIAPLVYTDSIDMQKAFYQSRYDKGEGKDYLNCPLTKEEYNIFLEALLKAPTVAFKEWEENTPYFEGCLPIEVMAARGFQTLRYGPMKPIGLTNPFEENRKPFAVVQLRTENKQNTLMNMVGFQTKMTHTAQKEVFSLIPALKNASFARLGGIHRNTFVIGPKILNPNLSLKQNNLIFLAGQVSGCEGYVESAAIGLLAGLFVANPNQQLPPLNTALGSLLHHITIENTNLKHFQPMNINFGLFPEIHLEKGINKKQFLTKNALIEIKKWIERI